MTAVAAKIVLTDIEGTTTSISFVKDVLFPYAKVHTESYLLETWTETETRSIVTNLIKLPQYSEFCVEKRIEQGKSITAEHVAAFVNYLIDLDLKIGPLKALQGLVWAKGYANGNLKGHVYDDVPAAFKRWHDGGATIAIYSSGSIKAQQLLFGQSIHGCLLQYICDYFDTGVGPKQEVQSYVKIAKELGVETGDILFLTDIIKEAEAARAAGMQTLILNRTGNSPLTDDQKSEFTVVNDFNSIVLILT